MKIILGERKRVCENGIATTAQTQNQLTENQNMKVRKYTIKLSATQIYNLASLLFTSKETDAKGKVTYGQLSTGGKSFQSVEKEVSKAEKRAAKDWLKKEKANW